MKPPRELWVVVRDGVVIHYASRRRARALKKVGWHTEVIRHPVG